MTGGCEVSVISIFLNEERFLPEAVESVLGQDFDGFELLLVDDGSSDASTELAKGYARRWPGKVRFLDHADHANRGMSASRNLGLRAARGRYVAFIDADDRWRTPKLREQWGLLERNPHVDAVFGCVNYWASWAGGEDRLVPSGHERGRAVSPPEALLSVYPLGRGSAPCPSDMMVKHAVALALGGFEESFTGPLQLYEDQAFLAKLYLNATVYFDDRIWLDYRLHDDSCVSQVTRRGLYHQVRRHYLEWLEDYVATSGQRTFAVQAALARALLPYRAPRLHGAARRLKSAIAGIGRHGGA